MSNLSSDNDQYLQNAVEEGIYPSIGQALNEAVELLRRRDRLRSDLKVAQDQADRGEFLDGEEVFEELLLRAREIEANARREQ
jgi:Arc/MetJ-type ribon-helix-helix transcriptional regulator